MLQGVINLVDLLNILIFRMPSTTGSEREVCRFISDILPAPLYDAYVYTLQITRHVPHVPNSVKPRDLAQVDAEIGAPRVNYRETVTRRAEFDYLHKKQSGGQGQYGRVVGYIEPLPEDSSLKFEYANEIVGNAIPPNYLPSCKKGFEEAVNSGKFWTCDAVFMAGQIHKVTCVL